LKKNQAARESTRIFENKIRNVRERFQNTLLLCGFAGAKSISRKALRKQRKTEKAF
jgi:hypothetical protein